MKDKSTAIVWPQLDRGFEYLLSADWPVFARFGKAEISSAFDASRRSATHPGQSGVSCRWFSGVFEPT